MRIARSIRSSYRAASLQLHITRPLIAASALRLVQSSIKPASSRPITSLFNKRYIMSGAAPDVAPASASFEGGAKIIDGTAIAKYVQYPPSL